MLINAKKYLRILCVFLSNFSVFMKPYALHSEPEELMTPSIFFSQKSQVVTNGQEAADIDELLSGTDPKQAAHCQLLKTAVTAKRMAIQADRLPHFNPKEDAVEKLPFWLRKGLLKIRPSDSDDVPTALLEEHFTKAKEQHDRLTKEYLAGQ